MYIDLNVSIPLLQGKSSAQASLSKKAKGKQSQAQNTSAPDIVYSPAQIVALEARIDVLQHLGYTIIAFNQVVQKKIDPKTHTNVIDSLLAHLRKRTGIAYLKRLTIVLDEDSEKGFGLTTGNASLVAPYDIIALVPTTATTFSLACLTHTQPSNLTAHIISLPLTLSRLPFNLKHTLVRSVLKNGAVFEITYAGALGGETDASLGVAGIESGSSAKRNWWAAAREVVRVTKGKGIVVSSGSVNQTDLRAPKDVGNLITFLGLAQNLAHDASSKTPQTLILRAQTRKTYRAILSEPKLVILEQFAHSQPMEPQQKLAQGTSEDPPTIPPAASVTTSKANPKKRTLDETRSDGQSMSNDKEINARNKKKKQSKGAGGGGGS